MLSNNRRSQIGGGQKLSASFGSSGARLRDKFKCSGKVQILFQRALDHCHKLGVVEPGPPSVELRRGSPTRGCPGATEIVERSHIYGWLCIVWPHRMPAHGATAQGNTECEGPEDMYI